MTLTEHFTLEEFTRSDTATRLGIDNTIPVHLMDEALLTAQMLERVRAHLTKLAGREIPIDTSSVYRCLLLNRELKSDDTSDHVKMAAADFRADKFGTPYEVCAALLPVVQELGIGQLIHEFGRWVHIGRLKPAKQINAVLTYKFPKIVMVGIHKV